MTDKEILIGKLQTFKKYGFQTWLTFYELDFESYKAVTCDCIDELIEGVNNDCSNRELKRIMKPYIAYLRNLHIGETEEREYIAEVYYDISLIISVDIAFSLNRVIYGWTLTALTTNPFEKKKKWIDIVNITKKIVNPCKKCNYKMTTNIIDYPKMEGDNEQRVVDMHAIINCKVCGQMDLVFITEDGDLAQSFDYYIREELPEEWTVERATQRMEQLKVWGKV